MQQLSKREIKVLLQLLDTEESLTTRELAETHAVSIRTVKYDLDRIRAWLKERDQVVSSRRSKGIWLDLSDSRRLELKNELMDTERFELYPDQKMRLSRLFLILLLTNEHVTSKALADQLEVSKNTVLSDLDHLEKRLLRHQLRLDRQNRQGFLIKGPEKMLRLAMEKVCQKNFTEYDIYQIMACLLNTAKPQQKYFAAVNQEFQALYDEVLQEMGDLLACRKLEEFNYAEILAMTLRVAISAARMKNGFTMDRYKLLANQALLSEKKELPFLLMKALFERFELPLLEDEYLYIYSDAFEKNDEQDVLHLTRRLIEDVSCAMELPFVKDTQLATNLFAHLSLRLSRKQKFINEYNPFSDDIKAKYPKLFAAIKQTSTKNIDGSALLINDSFIAYIALHFLVSYEKQQEKGAVRVVYVCSTGLGVTNLIQQRISEEVNNIEIASFASVLNAQEVIAQKDPDLVISIFPLEERKRPVIKVHPLPTPEDMEQIKETVHKIAAQVGRKPRLVPRKTKSDTQSIEAQSRDVIVKGYVIYEELKKIFEGQLERHYQEAFLLHVFLMVHRITFDQQYENEGNVAADTLLAEAELVEKIETLFAESELAINRAEISALLIYIQEGA